MKVLKKVSAFALVFAFALLTAPTAAFAATTPSLGAASTYGVLASTYTDTSAATTINGDVGFTTPPATAPAGVHTNYGSGTPYSTAGTDQGSALSALAAKSCTFTFAAGAINLSTDTTHGTAGVYGPGVYCSTGAMNVGGPLTLSGSGTYIFRPVGALTSTAGSVVTLASSASACDVFWTPSAATTLAANTTFVGTVIDNSGITVGANTTWTGRALAFGGTVTTATDTITVPTCTGTLHIVKTVVNDSGGTALASAFNLHVKLSGVDVSGSPAVGIVSPGTSYTLAAGTYVVSEDANASYTQSFSGACDASGNVTLTAGADVTCTITNNDIAAAQATLHIVKTVVNDSGGTALASAFNLHVKLSGVDVSGSPAVGIVSPGTSYTLAAGTYVVSEDANASYTQSFSGACDASGNVTLTAGADVTCTITNNDIAAVPATGTINVVKTVVNDNGGTKIVSDFPLFIDGSSVTSGVTNTFAAPATYTVTETADSNYTRTFSGDCDVNGNVSLLTGGNMFCIITNDDIAPVVVTSSTTVTSSPAVVGGTSEYIPVPPLIDVVKVPSPLALPDGPGMVEYTYTLTNIGTVSVSDITMVGDTCSPILLISGDTDDDARLDVTETWTNTCSTTLSETHTNTVVTTGWANGLSAVDIASATVIVGLPVVPPLIHVTKIPSPLALLAGGGMVTYTETITNPGTVALSNVTLEDDKCSPMLFVSGDTNGDSLLDPTESWIYTCETNLTRTTTNTAIASGEANGITMRDFAIATVVVAAPGFPSTGLRPEEQSASAGIALLAGILLMILSSVVYRPKKT